MESEVKKFKRGDFIVSGKGNVGMFLSSIVEWESFFRLTDNGSRAGTDWGYARYATEDEKKKFIERAIKANLRDADRKLLYESAGIKKRFRPSLNAYRELLRENDKLNEIFKQSVKAQKKAETELLDLKSKIGLEYISTEEYIKVAKEVDRLKVEIERWKDSSKQLEERHNALEAENKALKEVIVGLKERLNIIKNRGLFARIFNKFPDDTDC